MTIVNRIALALIAVACLACTAQATDYTFQAADGIWHNPDNWDPSTGVPGSTDKATIPSEKNCRIEGDASIRTLVVEGTLHVKGHTLTIASGGAEYQVTVNGSIDCEVLSGNAPTLHLGTNVSVQGTGAIVGKEPAYPLLIDTADNDYLLHLGGSGQGVPTISGSVQFHVNLCNDSLVLVECSDQVMEIGLTGTSGQTWNLSGSDGKFRTEAGTMKFGRVYNYFIGTWDVQGGTLELLNCNLPWTGAAHSVIVAGGTLKLDTYLLTTGSLAFTGGTIRVAATMIVQFGA